MPELNSTQMYLYQFIMKLIDDTNTKKLDWICEPTINFEYGLCKSDSCEDIDYKEYLFHTKLLSSEKCIMIIPVIVCIDEVSIDSCESYQLYIYDSVSAIMEPISSVFHEINTNVLLKN